MFILIQMSDWKALTDSIAALDTKIDYLHRMVSRNFTIVEQKEDSIMTATDDLNTAVANLTAGFAAESTAVQAEIAALVAASNNDPVIAQAAANITAIVTGMAKDASDLTNSLNPPTPVPAPVVPPPAVALAAKHNLGGRLPRIRK